ncbi:MAG: MxaK protein [Gammaproteobacteria bacterium]
MPLSKKRRRLTLFNTYHPVGAWLLLVFLAALALLDFDDLYKRKNFNAMIENPKTITLPDAELPPEVLFAKARYLNQAGHFQEALRLYLAIENAGGPAFRNDVHYNMGVIYLSQAARLWHDKGVWEYSQINILLDLAEQYLHEVLSVEPEFWPARFNLEYALRIRPPAKEQEKADWQGQKSSVHAIMPGIPEGGP